MHHAIEFDRVSHRYSGVDAIRELDVKVPSGCLFGLIGRSGAGKTTTLRILLGFQQPRHGQSRILGVPSRHLSRLAGKIGVTLDRPALFPHLTVREHLVLHGRAHGRRIDGQGILERLDLARLDRQRASRLSAGERQRLSLARALVLEPEVLILDEPLVHLDPSSAAQVLEVLRGEVDRGCTVFLSSHQLAYVERVADRLALLDHGEIRLHGAVDELLQDCDAWLRIRAWPRERARDILETHPLVEEIAEDRSGDGLRLRLRESSPEQVNAALIREGVHVGLLAPAESSLDDLFLRSIQNGRGPSS